MYSAGYCAPFASSWFSTNSMVHIEMSSPRQDHPQCNVCLNSFNNTETVVLDCTHSFCKNCVIRLLQEGEERCPTCRQTLSGWACSAIGAEFLSKITMVRCFDCDEHQGNTSNGEYYWCATCGNSTCSSCKTKIHESHDVVIWSSYAAIGGLYKKLNVLPKFINRVWRKPQLAILDKYEEMNIDELLIEQVVENFKEKFRKNFKIGFAEAREATSSHYDDMIHKSLEVADFLKKLFPDIVKDVVLPTDDTLLNAENNVTPINNLIESIFPNSYEQYLIRGDLDVDDDAICYVEPKELLDGLLPQMVKNIVYASMRGLPPVDGMFCKTFFHKAVTSPQPSDADDMIEVNDDETTSSAMTSARSQPDVNVIGAASMGIDICDFVVRKTENNTDVLVLYSDNAQAFIQQDAATGRAISLTSTSNNVSLNFLAKNSTAIYGLATDNSRLETYDFNLELIASHRFPANFGTFTSIDSNNEFIYVTLNFQSVLRLNVNNMHETMTLFENKDPLFELGNVACTTKRPYKVFVPVQQPKECSISCRQREHILVLDGETGAEINKLFTKTDEPRPCAAVVTVVDTDNNLCVVLDEKGICMFDFDGTLVDEMVVKNRIADVCSVILSAPFLYVLYRHGRYSIEIVKIQYTGLEKTRTPLEYEPETKGHAV